MPKFPSLGFGCGLRAPHHRELLDSTPRSIDWFEAIAETYLPWTDGTLPRSIHTLEKIRSHYPVVLHGVSLSLGSTDSLDLDHLKKIQALCKRIDAAWFSDHLCWTGVNGTNHHDLLPLPYTEEALDHVASRVLQVQDFLGRTMLIENVSSYLTFKSSSMTEASFLRELVARTDCGLLLDINNVFVSSQNHGTDAWEYLSTLPWDSVAQIHLAGHRDKGAILIDTHDEPVSDAVWELYRMAVKEWGPVTTMIERDDKIPEWPVLEAEVTKARTLCQKEGYAESFGTPAAL
jgi:uncharacterized protein